MGERADNVFKTTGSQWLLPVSEHLGFPLDQVNFLACQLFALLAAFWFRVYLSPHHSNPLVRHAVATLLGITFLIFCFGWYSAHIMIVVLANYLIIIQADISNVHRYSMVIAMGYLTVCQVSRVFIFNYGILSTDFSGPLMIVTQKITTLAFQLHDGMCKKAEQLTSEQKLLSINVRPSLIEYLSYNLNFLSVLVGPCSNYKDYIDFIEGKHISNRLRRHHGTRNGKNGYHKVPDPSPLNAVCQKLLVCCACMLFFLIITRSLPITHNVHPDFVDHAPFVTRLTYAFFSIQAARPKFYFAWTLADAVHNAAGYGFLGMDENGKYSWDLISNLNIMRIETATSFKTFIDNWNIQTGNWLKTVCYERALRHRLALTFILSALWHGVYPGYYFTFITAIPITLAARAVRKSFRHYFLGSRGLKLGYDILTWAATQLAICYTVMPFLLLAVEPTMMYYRSMYFHVHIISLVAVIVLHPKCKSKAPKANAKPTDSLSASCLPQCLPLHCNNNDETN
ncbi:lysophospholipid acyltransferase 1 isoform X1 [Dunckerocampus dactyliophorus]|uniref:lysophospholipid acyltransferase 1 isoform X1 n=2 Tax=Dunckerocampus dactyliophorus TaxID=161453 RepID=UPI0024064230|nr:lysophospholipid acyltransferase 1 isoform X1 [Dunckerocampus dactyliophorus]